jgi:hypothetical protein
MAEQTPAPAPTSAGSVLSRIPWAHIARAVRIVAYALAANPTVDSFLKGNSVTANALVGAVVAALVTADVVAKPPAQK